MVATGGGVVATGAAVVGAGGAVVADGAGATLIAGSGEKERLGIALADGDGPAVPTPGRMTIRRPKAMSAMRAAARNAASWTLDPVTLGLPPETQLARWPHVAEQRG